ncbi:MAG: M23 family peptidase, partial [Calditrichota bacterium]
MKKKIIVFILCLIPLAAHGQNYLWPTDASHYLTSTFGEYRARHFHSALDIKTWNRIGYKVYAVDDGYIWRIRTSNTGYGKVLYEKLKDGNIAVYAHLDHFQAPIEKFMEQLQDKQGEYEQDYFPTPSQYRVKRGE